MPKKTVTPKSRSGIVGGAKAAGRRPAERMTGNEVRQAFLDFFREHHHTVVPSSSLVPGGDATLLFTNAGMVQFKDVFLGTDKRPYSRAVTVQKCMRVSGKHNDLENVGPSPRHHTFFEMLGNFSFGDYFKREACRFAYDCVTKVYGIPADRLFFTVHKDDDEAYNIWVKEIGVPPERVARLGDKTNFWQMADVGPCGPTAEIHYDWHPELGVPDAEALKVQLDANPDERMLEIWNLVFMQFNQTPDGKREPLPKPGVDTGMGLERITSIVQGVDNSYDTDLFSPIMARIQELAGHTEAERRAGLVAYRVIADHTRAATFMIGDGVIPGNTGRNYVCRMVIRRAARFGNKLGFQEPFLARVAETVIEHYGGVYPEIVKHRADILRTLTQEEERFARTVDMGIANLSALLTELSEHGQTTVSGQDAFNLYATYGLPLEITRDIAQERGLKVDEAGFAAAREAHAEASRSEVGPLGGEDVNVYRPLLQELQAEGKLGPEGVEYDPYTPTEFEETVLALVKDGKRVTTAKPGDKVEVLLPRTCFYVAAGGQVSDTGYIARYVGDAEEPVWEIRVDDMRRPAAGVVVHVGEVTIGNPRVGDTALVSLDIDRRWDIMRNHTATHLLHSELRYILGEHVRQAGSLVAPDRLRFDFTHTGMLTQEQINQVTRSVNEAILANYPVNVEFMPREKAIAEGAMALFGEKYGEMVRTIKIGEPEPFSFELCGGTHVPETADIGPFFIVSEEAAAAGIRRIEAVTGRGALDLIQQRLGVLENAATYLKTTPAELDRKVLALLDENQNAQKEIARLRRELAKKELDALLERMDSVKGVPVLAGALSHADADTLREMTDRFRQRVPSGVAVLGSVTQGRPSLIACVTEDLVKRGLDAGKLVKTIAAVVGGSGGGKSTLAQAGGKDASKLNEALAQVKGAVEAMLR
ncbi:MAG: alanine--tRNA ligase [Anaerolineales bacterium]|nr:alanine--tRNA ligase [Anaerolineales bacterium]